mmetsp:Transcript_53433/g.126379  ORF Transcript_53433/g.126379 Transcript_53433/m.126379 type:complete len:301 (-) Transcript_53433:2725-3627(-)
MQCGGDAQERSGDEADGGGHVATVARGDADHHVCPLPAGAARTAVERLLRLHANLRSAPTRGASRQGARKPLQVGAARRRWFPSAPGGAQCAHHQGAAAPCLRARRRLWPDLGDGPRSAPTPRRCSIRARRRGRRGRERKQSQRCRIARLADDGGGVDWRALGHRAGPTPRIARPAVRAEHDTGRRERGGAVVGAVQSEHEQRLRAAPRHCRRRHGEQSGADVWRREDRRGGVTQPFSARETVGGRHITTFTRGAASSRNCAPERHVVHDAAHHRSLQAPRSPAEKRVSSNTRSKRGPAA